MNPLVLGVTELTQLAAIGPCIFLVIYLLLTSQNYKLAIIPAAYFLLLAGTFIFPILSIFPNFNSNTVSTLQLVNQHFLPTASFLFIAQLIYRRFPPAIYFAPMALPLLGSTPLIIISTYGNEFCFKQDFCFYTTEFLQLYNIITSGLIFLLVTITLSQRQNQLYHETITRKHKYWLIIALISYNMLILTSNILLINDYIDEEKNNFFQTMFGLCFIYLAMTSIFRVFNENFRIVPLSSSPTHKEALIANKIRTILDEEKPYLKSGYNRGNMADQLGLTEQHLSRIINNSFNKTFTDLMNEQRIHYAKALLRDPSNKLSITDIAYQAGFSSIATFNRVFKHAEGTTPRQYKKQAD